MTLRKVLGLFGLLLLLGWAGYVFANAATSSVLFFQGNKVSPEVKWVVINDTKYINLLFFTKQLGIQAIWRSDSGVIQLQMGKTVVNLEEDKCSYLWDNTPKQLAAAPFEKDGQLWLPLELLPAFGVTVKAEDQQTLELDWAEDYLLAIAATTYEGRPALILTGSKPLQHTDFLLSDPARLVINLKQVKVHPSFDGSTVQNQLVNQVRYSQFDSETLRLVCDLVRTDGYQIIPAPNQPNQLIVVFNYFLQEVNLLEEAGEQKIQIKTDLPAEYTVKKLTNPARAVIDFDNATLEAPIEVLKGNHKWFNQVRVSQFNLKTVRVVVDLSNDNSLFKVSRSRRDPKLLEVRTVQYVREIKLESTPVADKLVVTGSDELDAEIVKLSKSSRLFVNLDFFRFPAQLKTPSLQSDTQLKGIRLLTLSPTMARIEIEYKYFVGYEIDYSPDARQLTLSLLKSPLVNRTLVIDAGHGGEDMGATGKQGTREKLINLDVTMRLRERLQEAGANVLLTRDGDYFIGLYERAHLANRSNGDLFVSIHSNFHPNSEVQGLEVYHYKNLSASGVLARKIEARMAQYMSIPSLGVKVNDFVVIRETIMPSVLVELGYLSNTREEKIMNTVAFKDSAASGIFRGIVDYFQEINCLEQL